MYWHYGIMFLYNGYMTVTSAKKLPPPTQRLEMFKVNPIIVDLFSKCQKWVPEGGKIR